MFSYVYFAGMGYKLPHFIRLQGLSDLFYDRIVDNPLVLRCDDLEINLGFRDGTIGGNLLHGEQKIAQLFGAPQGQELTVSHSGMGEEFSSVRFYRFPSSRTGGRPESTYLIPPYGDNLTNVLRAHTDVHQEAALVFENAGLELEIRDPDRELLLVKRMKRASISYPYVLASDTFQRMVFYLTAMRTNKNSVLLFEEPESHAFPYYTASLAEDIALDQNGNQYFITTHNPYFLRPLVEKTPREDLQVLVTYLENYETKVTEVTPKDLAKLDQADIFWNLRRYVPKTRVLRVR